MAYPKLTDEPGALSLAALIRNGALSPLEAVDAAIGRIEAMDGEINAVVVRDFDRARETAKAKDGQYPDPAQPLFGVPMTVKESFDIAGLPSCWGREEFAGQLASRDAKVVTRLKRAGAVILGKTNIPPDLADLQSDNPVYGRTSNPHDHSRVAGGSSGGAAAAVASGMVPCEYGSDIGSSIRNPAHFCGIFGHKTSYGLVTKHGHGHPMAKGHDMHPGEMSVVGPLARNARDLAALLEITADLPLPRRGRKLSECRFLAILDHPVSEVDDGVRGPIEAALSAFEAAGAQVDRTSALLPDLAAQNAAYLKMLAITMARGAPGPDGQRATASDWFALLDLQTRNELAWEGVFGAYDFVLAPPLPFLAYKHDPTPIHVRKIAINGAEHDFGEALAWAGLATFPNLPSTVVPVGATDGLPCGMQVMGPRWGDYDCIAMAGEIAQLLHG